MKYIKSTTKKVKKVQNFIFHLHTCKYFFVKKSKKVKKTPLHNLKKGTIKINTSKIVDDNNDNKKQRKKQRDFFQKYLLFEMQIKSSMHEQKCY